MLPHALRREAHTALGAPQATRLTLAGDTHSPTCNFLAINTERLKLISSDPRIMELKNCSAQTRSRPATWIPYSQVACNSQRADGEAQVTNTQKTPSAQTQSRRGN